MLIKRKILLLLSITIIPLIFGGCYDLGDAAQTDDEYCDNFAEIRFIDANSSASYYSMEDFYNEEAVNEFKTPMDEDDRSEYTYILIKVDKDLSLGDLSVFFDSTVGGTLSVSFFILDEGDIPTKVYTGAGGKYKLSESDEPDDRLMVAKTSCRLEGKVGKWNSAYLKTWGVNNERLKSMEIKEDQYLVLRLDNNCCDSEQRLIDSAKETLDKASEEYDQKRIEWETISADSHATQQEKNNAMDELSRALAAKNVAEREYETVKKAHAGRASLEKMPVRVTAILINAN